MFSDGTEGFDKCLSCEDSFERPLVIIKTPAEWFEAIGSEPTEKVLQRVDEEQYPDDHKMDRRAKHSGFCTAHCQIEYLDKDNHKMINNYEISHLSISAKF